MATSTGVVCEICEAQHITKSAIYWCPECEEGLCSECQKHHSLSKGTRNHEIISIENYLRLPSSISKIATYCNEHNFKYQNYCPQHDTICCSVCISEYHKNCCGLKSLQEIVKKFKASASIENIEQILSDMRSNYDNIMKDRKRNLAKVENQRKCFYTEIKQLREKITSYLDSLEEQIIVDLNATEHKIKSKIENVMSKLSEKINTVETLQTSISSVKKYASDLQTFIGIKSLEEDVQREEKVFQSLIDDGSFHQTNLKCSMSKKISDIFTTITGYGSVDTETSKSCIVLKTDKAKYAQNASAIPHPLKSIDNISISLKSKFPFSADLYGLRGFTVSSSGLMGLSTYYGKLVIFYTNATFDLIKTYPTSCNDVAFIDDRTVAASIEERIEIIKIDSKVTERVFRTSGTCKGICTYNGTLICHVLSKGIQQIQLSNGNITHLVRQRDPALLSYITIHKDKIYQTSSDVFFMCYTMKGEKLWEFNSETIGGIVRDITVDNSGNVYVLFNANCILLLSPDGQRSRELKIKEMAETRRLHINGLTNSLTVAGLNGTVLFYDILYTN